MEIVDAISRGQSEWNRFVKEHYPAVGAFMQSWEWGEFQKALGRKIERYFIIDEGVPVAAFTLVHYSLPFGFSYGYIPRGPSISVRVSAEKVAEILRAIKRWVAKEFPDFIFVRLEPPLSSVPLRLETDGFCFPKYYIQPRYNLAVPLFGKTEEEIAAAFHPSTRSNINRSEKRGATVAMKAAVADGEYAQFSEMIKETIKRNRGKNAYPNHSYLHSLLKVIPVASTASNPNALALGIFYGYQNRELAAIHFALFFGNTATYLYGASFSKYLSSKVVTLLHWSSMKEAKQRGFRYYDLGGIDEHRWPSLTNFKRQFRGEEFSYLGNIDIPIRPALYHLYNFLRRLKK